MLSVSPLNLRMQIDPTHCGSWAGSAAKSMADVVGQGLAFCENKIDQTFGVELEIS